MHSTLALNIAPKMDCFRTKNYAWENAKNNFQPRTHTHTHALYTLKVYAINFDKVKWNSTRISQFGILFSASKWKKPNFFLSIK